MVIYVCLGTGTFCKENFQTGFVGAGAGFFPSWTLKTILLSWKREINTFENFPCEIFFARYPLCALFILHYF